MAAHVAPIHTALLLGLKHQPQIRDDRFTISAHISEVAQNPYCSVRVQAHRDQMGGEPPPEESVEVIPGLNFDVIARLQQHSLADARILSFCAERPVENLRDALVTEIIAKHAGLTLLHSQKEEKLFVEVILTIAGKRWSVVLNDTSKYSRFFVGIAWI